MKKTTSVSPVVGADPESATRGPTGYVGPLVGLATIVAIIATVAMAVGLFQGDFTTSVPVRVLSARAGLVMNPDAKVKLHGVEVGKVASIDSLPDGQAALNLAINPSWMHLIPANVGVDITSSTVFGAKFVQLTPPPDPSPHALQAGQTLSSKHVTVETNTLFQRLTSVLSKIEPAKLNEVLGAFASAFNGRGRQIGQMLSDLDALLVKLDPSLPVLRHDFAVAPAVVNAYADAAPNLMGTVDGATRISQTIVDEQHNLEALLLSTIGLADVGTEVLGGNRALLTDVVHLLVPTTDLLSQYHEALWCGISGLSYWWKQGVAKDPGITISIGLDFGAERYRYPGNLPRVAARGGPQCTDLPAMPFQGHAPFVVGDVGANPFQYGNQGLLWDSDLIKQWLFGPLDGPPRNTQQIGQPG